MNRSQYGDCSTYLRVSPDCWDETVGSFRCHLPSHLSELQRVKAVELVSVTIPHTIYNINRVNNHFYADGQSINSALPVGHYSLDSFQQETDIGSFNGTAIKVVALKDATYKLKIIGPQGVHLRGPLLEIFGIPIEGGTINTGGELYASFLPNFDYPSEVYIRCPQLTSSFLIVDGKGNGGPSEIFAVVPMNVAFGDHMQYEPRYHVQEYKGGYKALSVLDFQFLDCKGVPLPFLGQTWHMTLRIYYTFDY